MKVKDFINSLTPEDLEKTLFFSHIGDVPPTKHFSIYNAKDWNEYCEDEGFGDWSWEFSKDQVERNKIFLINIDYD